MPSRATRNFSRARAAVLLFTQSRENPADRLRQGQNFFLGGKFFQHLRLVRDGAQAAADVEGEASAQQAVLHPCLGNEAHVVHVGQAAALVGAARKRNLDLAAEVLSILVVQQEIRQGVGIRRHVEALVAADTRQGARRHVAHHIAARLLCGDADGRQAPHQVRRIVDMDEMELEILPRRDVADGV